MMKKITSLAVAMICVSGISFAHGENENVETDAIIAASFDATTKMIEAGQTAEAIEQLDAVANQVEAEEAQGADKSKLRTYECVLIGATAAIATASFAWSTYTVIKYKENVVENLRRTKSAVVERAKKTLEATKNGTKKACDFVTTKGKNGYNFACEKTNAGFAKIKGIFARKGVLVNNQELPQNAEEHVEQQGQEAPADLQVAQ